MRADVGRGAVVVQLTSGYAKESVPLMRSVFDYPQSPSVDAMRRPNVLNGTLLNCFTPENFLVVCRAQTIIHETRMWEDLTQKKHVLGIKY